MTVPMIVHYVHSNDKEKRNTMLAMYGYDIDHVTVIALSLLLTARMLVSNTRTVYPGTSCKLVSMENGRKREERLI
jgi:hypothetical protein